MRVKGRVLKAGDWISLDSTTGRVINGQHRVLTARLAAAQASAARS